MARMSSSWQGAIGYSALNIAILVVFALTVLPVRLLWIRFRANRIDPVVDDIGEGWDAAGDAVAAKRGRIRAWLDTWQPKHKR